MVVSARSVVMPTVPIVFVFLETRVIRFVVLLLSITHRILEKLERIVTIARWTRIIVCWLHSNLLRLIAEKKNEKIH